MNDRIRFHLDEHIDARVAAGLLRHGIDVTTTNEAGLRTTDDPTQFEYAMRTDRAFVTGDYGLIPLAASLPEHPGLAICARHRLSIGDQIRAIILLYEVMTAADMRGHVEHLS